MGWWCDSTALLKEAYVGEPSRPFFPLTAEFAAGSNNSTVAMTNTTVVIPDTQHMDDDVAYYVCSSKVRSEVCAPIAVPKLVGGGVPGSKDEVEGSGPAPGVIGIIDVEAWDAHHFSPAHIDVILHTCAELGRHTLFIGPLQ